MWTLPIIDMQEPEASARLIESIKEYGFFMLKGHGVSEEKMQRVFEGTRAFFGLPLESKMTLVADKMTRGYTPKYEQTLDPENQTKPDTKEGFLIVKGRTAGSNDDLFRAFGDSIAWPPEDVIMPGWKDLMEDYFDTMQDVGLKLARLIAEGLGLDTEFFAKTCSSSMATLKLIHYFNEVSDPDAGVVGAGAHTDFGVLTLLATDEVPGLQIKVKDEWRDVPPRPGVLFCNVGDLLQRWTNDYLPSVMHRVVNKLGCERYSIPFFFDADFDTEVACIPKYYSEDNPARYPPTFSGRHIVGRIEEAFDSTGVEEG